jgi:hypothetical protein
MIKLYMMRKYKIIKGEYLTIGRGGAKLEISYKLLDRSLSPIVKMYIRSPHFAAGDTIYITLRLEKKCLSSHL